MTNKDLIALGFNPMKHITIGNMVIYSLGRDRHLSASSVGTPNEVMFICESNEESGKVSDAVCIHNYDYDGYLTEDRVNKFIELLDYKRKNGSIQTSEATEGR